MAIPSRSSSSVPKVKSLVGAPSQRTQSSRKGKRAWRKNVDLDEVEEGLEDIRAQERILGSTVHSQTNDQLFQIDTAGDEHVRRNRPKFSVSQLTSAKIIAQRSAVPAFLSRSSTTSASTKRKISHEEKDRLRRIGKRMKSGPFNAVMDPTEIGAGSALLEVSEAAKKSGGYDVWATEDGRGEDEEDVVADVPVAGKKGKVKAPNTPHPRTQVAIAAVVAPHEGTSYNPPVESHHFLLRTAHENEVQKLEEAERQKEVKEKMENARRTAAEEFSVETLGMKVVDGNTQVEEGDGENAEAELRPTKRMPARKTKQERRKAEKIKAEKRALAEKVNQRRMLAVIASAKSIRKTTLQKHRLREKLRAQREAELQQKLKNGLAGQKIGKHIVPTGEIDVQLGEDLSESLRGLKTEGNLFRDRFLSMQQRALIEPRVRVLPKKRKAKIIEYEKHPFKRFDREN